MSDRSSRFGIKGVRCRVVDSLRHPIDSHQDPRPPEGGDFVQRSRRRRRRRRPQAGAMAFPAPLWEVDRREDQGVSACATEWRCGSRVFSSRVRCTDGAGVVSALGPLARLDPQ